LTDSQFSVHFPEAIRSWARWPLATLNRLLMADLLIPKIVGAHTQAAHDAIPHAALHFIVTPE